MSKFYGTVQGARGQATRCGHTSIGAAAQSWDGSVIVWLTYRDDDLMVQINTSDGSSPYGHMEWKGTFDEFKQLLRA